MAACVEPMYLPKRERYVPCGKCGYCLKNRKEDWQFRIANEMKYCDSVYFVTLTYSDEYVPIQYGTGLEILSKDDLQNFFKRLRYYHSLHSKSQIRYYAVGEYGSEFLRPHYHIILFNALFADVEKAWPLGFVQVEPPNMGAVGYTVGYVSSVDNLSVGRGVPKQFALMSKRPALGYRYLHTHSKWHTDGLRNYSQINGIGGRLPRYYKKKMFNESQKEILSERALEAYENQYNTLFLHYKALGYSDPHSTVREQQRFNESVLMQKILETKKKI